MSGRELMADFVDRLTRDVRLKFPEAEVAYAHDNVCISFGEGWCTVSSSIDADDTVSPLQAERYVAETAETLINNGWPDESPWPPCPRHRDHPLQVGVIRGRASWYCAKDEGVTAMAVGDLRVAGA